MGGKDGSELQALQGLRDGLGVDALADDPAHGIVEPRVPGLALMAELVGPVHLLGDVGQLEVGGEGPGAQQGGGGLDRGQEAGEGGGPGVVAGRPGRLRVGPDVLDQLDDAVPLGHGDLLAEERGQEPDVVAHGRVSRLGAHRVVGGGRVVDVERAGVEVVDCARHAVTLSDHTPAPPIRADPLEAA